MCDLKPIQDSVVRLHTIYIIPVWFNEPYVMSRISIRGTYGRGYAFSKIAYYVLIINQISASYLSNIRI